MKFYELLTSFPALRLTTTGGNCTAYEMQIDDVEVTITGNLEETWGMAPADGEETVNFHAARDGEPVTAETGDVLSCDDVFDRIHDLTDGVDPDEWYSANRA